MTYLQLPMSVRAFLWEEQPMVDWPKWLIGPNFTLTDRGTMAVYNQLYDCWLDVPKGYWIVMGSYGELFPVRPDVFADRFREPQPEKTHDDPPQVNSSKKFWKK